MSPATVTADGLLMAATESRRPNSPSVVSSSIRIRGVGVEADGEHPALPARPLLQSAAVIDHLDGLFESEQTRGGARPPHRRCGRSRRPGVSRNPRVVRPARPGWRSWPVGRTRSAPYGTRPRRGGARRSGTNGCTGTVPVAAQEAVGECREGVDEPAAHPPPLGPCRCTRTRAGARWRRYGRRWSGRRRRGRSCRRASSMSSAITVCQWLRWVRRRASVYCRSGSVTSGSASRWSASRAAAAANASSLRAGSAGRSAPWARRRRRWGGRRVGGSAITTWALVPPKAEQFTPTTRLLPSEAACRWRGCRSSGPAG